jgi:hypothetical protein
MKSLWSPFVSGLNEKWSYEEFMEPFEDGLNKKWPHEESMKAISNNRFRNRRRKNPSPPNSSSP